MTNLQSLEERLIRIYNLKRIIKKGEKIFKGDNRKEVADNFEKELIDHEMDYDVAIYKTMIIFTFPEESQEPITIEVNCSELDKKEPLSFNMDCE